MGIINWSPNWQHPLKAGCTQMRKAIGLVIFTCTLAAALPLDGNVQAKSLHRDSELLAGKVGQYGDWLAACDNQANCTMIGFPKSVRKTESGFAPAALMAMRVDIEALSDPELGPSIEIFPVKSSTFSNAQSRTAAPVNYAIHFGGDSSLNYRVVNREYLTPTEAKAALENLLENERLTGHVLFNYSQHVLFPGAGFREAHRAVLAHQIRLRAALAHNEEIDSEGRPPNFAAPTRSSIVARTADSRRPSISCGQRRKSKVINRYRLHGGSMLWAIACNEMSLNTKTYFYNQKDGPIALPVNLPEPRLGAMWAGRDGLPNAVFDFDFSVLRAYDFQGPNKDCGTFWAWGLTDFDWHLLERREMPVCNGLDPTDWLRTFKNRSVVVKAHQRD
jgi:Protein of unknown function (DUF1176)